MKPPSEQLTDRSSALLDGGGLPRGRSRDLRLHDDPNDHDAAIAMRRLDAIFIPLNILDPRRIFDMPAGASA